MVITIRASDVNVAKILACLPESVRVYLEAARKRGFQIDTFTIVLVEPDEPTESTPVRVARTPPVHPGPVRTPPVYQSPDVPDWKRGVGVDTR